MAGEVQTTPSEYLQGVPLPFGKPKRLLIVDRTELSAEAWARFNTADLFIGAKTPIVYTMCRHNLVRLKESIDAALAEFDSQEAPDSY